MGKLQTLGSVSLLIRSEGHLFLFVRAEVEYLSCQPFAKARQIMPDLVNGEVGAAGVNSGEAAGSLVGQNRCSRTISEAGRVL